MVLAHAGHWLPQLLYLAPVLGVGGLVAWEKWKTRHKD